MTVPKFKPKVPRRSVEEFKRQGMWTFSSRLSYLTYGLRYGIYSLIPPSLRWFLPLIQEDVKDLFRPETGSETAAGIDLSPEIEAEFPTSSLPLYEKYRCPFNNPLNCQESRQAITTIGEITSCPKCGFPTPLPPREKFKGNGDVIRLNAF